MITVPLARLVTTCRPAAVTKRKKQQLPKKKAQETITALPVATSPTMVTLINITLHCPRCFGGSSMETLDFCVS